jgi:hypothetical protein
MTSLLALAVPSLREGIVFVIVLAILGVLYQMLEPFVGEPFRPPIRLVIVILLIAAVLHLFGLF